MKRSFIIGIILSGFLTGWGRAQSLVTVAGDQVTVSAGTLKGVKVGMMAYVLDTEEIGGKKETVKIAKIKITQVSERSAKGVIVSRSPGYTVRAGLGLAFIGGLKPPAGAAASRPDGAGETPVGRKTPPPREDPAPDAGSPGANLKRGQECLDRGEYDRAKRSFGYVLRDVPDDPKATAGVAAAENGLRNAEAERARKEKLGKELKMAPYFEEQGDASLAAGEYAMALDYYGRILAVVPDDAKMRGKAAVVRLKQGDAAAGRGEADAAWDFYGQALELSPSDAAPRAKLTALLERRAGELAAGGRWDEAVALGRRAQGLPGAGWKDAAAGVFEALGDRLVGEKKAEAAGKAYQAALALDPYRSSAEAKRKKLTPEKFTNALGMTFVYVPPGSFRMGSDNGGSDEKPVHAVTISRGFHLQTTEVTQRQWREVMGNNPSYFSSCGDDCPVEQVSWNDAQEFIRRLNARGEGVYRLPTEAEWEYACRAGTTGDRYGDLESIAWYDQNSGSRTHPVGQKQPNAWGLYDMLGNVWEWCQDGYDAGYYANSPSADPAGPSSGSCRVYRGGGWFNFASFCRSAIRNGRAPDDRLNSLGFRLARGQ